MTPYYADEAVTLWHGDCREIMPTLGSFDCILTDPPYAETSLAWDRWPEAWPTIASEHAKSMWCFGSMRMFLDRRDEFMFWKLSQDVVWEKHNGSSFVADRFKRVHEHALHWYRGSWNDIHRDPQREVGGRDFGTARRSAKPKQGRLVLYPGQVFQMFSLTLRAIFSKALSLCRETV